jgi:putative transposase
VGNMSRQVRKRSKVADFKSQQELQTKLINEESLLSIAMADYSHKVLSQAVDRICSSMKGAHSWGEETGYVRAGLLRVPITRPRVRFEGSEVEIPEYEQLQKKDDFNEATRRAVMGGLATRSFRHVGEALGQAKGLSRSMISRVSKSFAEDFEKLMKADCSDIVAVFIDGIHFGDSCILAALGISRFGQKRLLSLWAGNTESKETCNAMFDDLKARNLNPKIFVIDGGKAVKASINQKFEWVPVQRCTVHKKRNLMELLSEKNAHWLHIEFKKIFDSNNFAEGLERAKVFHRELERLNESAARSWAECMPEILTTLQIKDPELRRTLSTTNPVESLFSAIRGITGRVRRWRTQSQILYWCSAAHARVQPQFHRIRGHKMLDQLGSLRLTKELLQESSAKEVAA